MLTLALLSIIIFLGVLFLVYCFVGFSRELSAMRRPPHVTRLPDVTKPFRERGKITRIAIAGLSLAIPAATFAQTSSPAGSQTNPPATAASTPVASAPQATATNPANNTPAPAPLAMPAMVGPLSTAPPRTFDAGPLGKLDVTGILSGFGSWQSYPSPGDKGARADISNAQIFIQKTNGFVQYYLQAGAYNIPALGTPTISTRNTISDFFGPLPQAYLKLAPEGNFLLLIGKLPTLIGAEYTFTFENLNIGRGLLWNQENAVNRGLQVNYGKGKLSSSVSWNDGFYSNRYNWLTGTATYAFSSSNSLQLVAAGNLGHTSYSTLATPLYQNNSAIYNIMYTHTAKKGYSLGSRHCEPLTARRGAFQHA